LRLEEGFGGYLVVERKYKKRRIEIGLGGELSRRERCSISVSFVTFLFLFF